MPLKEKQTKSKETQNPQILQTVQTQLKLNRFEGNHCNDYIQRISNIEFIF